MNKRILVIVPCYNEMDNLDSLINEIKNDFPEGDILVVNDCSTDDTLEVAKSNNVEILDLPVNLGPGWAVKAGLIYAREEEYDICVGCDGDGQHQPSNIIKIINPIKDNKADWVIGSRFMLKSDYKAGFIRRTGILLFSKMLSFFTTYQITDSSSGFRAFNKKSINFFSEHFSPDFPTVNPILFSDIIKFRLLEVSVTMRPRIYGQSVFTFFRYPLELIFHLLTIFVFILGRGTYRKRFKNFSKR